FSMRAWGRRQALVEALWVRLRLLAGIRIRARLRVECECQHRVQLNALGRQSRLVVREIKESHAGHLHFYGISERKETLLRRLADAVFEVRPHFLDFRLLDRVASTGTFDIGYF